MTLAIARHAGIHQHPQLCAVDANELRLEAGERSLIAQARDHRRPFAVRTIRLRDSVRHQVGARSETEHLRARFVTVEDSARSVGSIFAGRIAIEQVFESLGGRANDSDAAAMRSGDRADEQSGRKRHEPRSLIEECALPEQRRAGAPRAVITCCAYLESIRAGLQVRVKSDAACAGIRPLAIETLEPVLIVNFFGCGEVDSRVTELQRLRSGCKSQPAGRIDLMTVRKNVLDHHRWCGRGARAIRIDHRYAFGRCEPQLAVVSLPRDRLRSAVALAARHAVGASVRDARYFRRETFREIIELLTRYAEDSFVAAHPEIAVGVFEDREDAFVEQTFASR